MAAVFSNRERPRWGFVCGRLSVLEGRLASREFFASLLALQRPQDLLAQLGDTLVGESIGPEQFAADLHGAIDGGLHRHVLSVRDDCPATLPADLFLLRWDYLNLKNALLGGGALFFRGLLEPESIEQAAASELSQLPAPVAEVARLAREHADHDPRLLDAVLDGAYLRHLLLLGEGMAAPLVTDCIRDRVLASAVLLLWRSAAQGRSLAACLRHLLPLGPFDDLLRELAANPSPQGWPAVLEGVHGDFLSAAMELAAEERLAGFERLSTDHELRRSREARLHTSSPERVFAYLLAVTAEAQNLKLVVAGRLSQVDPALLRDRLRECHG